MISFPNAKINIGLYITEKRNDGFHNIETILYPISFCDILEVAKSGLSHTSLRQLGKKVEGISRKELSVMKAYELLKKDFNLPSIDIILYKNIPAGGGLGGGSSDATAMLKLLNDYFKLNLSNQELQKYTAQLGSDNSFFINNTPQLATKKGSVLESINLSLKGYYLVLLTPDIHSSTALAYQGVSPRKPNFDLTQIHTLPIDEWKTYIRNDFEDSLYSKYPLLKELKESLYQNKAIYASLSGSGATTYAIYKEKPSLPPALQKYVCFEGKIIN